MKWNPLLTRILYVFVLITCSGAAYFFFKQKGSPSELEKLLPNQESLKLGKRYRIFVTSVIVPPTDKDGDKWDAGGSSGAPDVFFQIFYKDNRIYESTTIDDVLVAEFSPVKAGITNFLTTKNVSDYLEAANVAYETEDSQFLVKVIDDDPLDNDLIGDLSVKLKDLKLGTNQIMGSDMSFQIVVIDADADINKSLKALKLLE